MPPLLHRRTTPSGSCLDALREGTGEDPEGPVDAESRHPRGRLLLLLEEGVAEEIDALAGEVNGRLTAINSVLTDVDARLENLYEALETRQLPIEALTPRILSLKTRQDQLTVAREEAESHKMRAA